MSAAGDRSGGAQTPLTLARLDGEAAIERLSALPGGEQVLRLAAAHEDVELVGGAVRDLLLGGVPREIDLVLDGAPATFPHAAAAFARDLVLMLPEDEQPQVSVHERFGTAAVSWSGGRVDLAARRAERYAHPGALPDVRPGGEQEDLRRRDFTVNAIALGLGGRRRGALRSVEGGLQDLRDGRLRVLHDRSFLDDPTRLLRLGRYAARLGFSVESHTAALAAAAIAEGGLRTVSPSRVGAELRLALREAELLATLRALADLGVLGALDPPLSLDAELLEQALSLLPHDGRRDALALACMLRPFAQEAGDDARARLQSALERWEHPAADRRAVVEAALGASSLKRELALADSPSRLWELLSRTAVEAVALAGATAALAEEGSALEAARSWISSLRHVRLQINGDDLLAAGVPAGPEIGRRLKQALRRRLDGTIEEGREAELRAALAR